VGRVRTDAYLRVGKPGNEFGHGDRQGESLPASISIIAATLVIGFVIE
jgi:hypothetical protein